MNSKQREFLANRLKSEFAERIKAHRKTEPKEPSLNNHLMVAFAEGSIKFANIDALKEKMRQRVLNQAGEEKEMKNAFISFTIPKTPFTHGHIGTNGKTSSLLRFALMTNLF